MSKVPDLSSYPYSISWSNYEYLYMWIRQAVHQPSTHEDHPVSTHVDQPGTDFLTPASIPDCSSIKSDQANTIMVMTLATIIRIPNRE